jgi:predicted ATPase
MSFSIIAIKTGAKPSKKTMDPQNKQIDWDHLKVLDANTLFKLNNAFTFENEDFEKISYSSDLDINIFKVQSDRKTIPVSIQAIVGGNGSGKSTLIELIYWANYNIGAKLNLFEDDYLVNKALDFQLFYRLNQRDYYLLKFKNDNIAQEEYSLDEDGKTILKIYKRNHISTITSLKNFFYSVVVNYSLYSLNEQEVGTWIHPLFHKNDAYQTPIVLNPKREEKSGINIEVERKLVSRRLQALCLEPIKNDEIIGSLRDFGNGKIAKKFKIVFNPEYHLGPNHNLEEPKGSIIELLAKNIRTVFSVETNIERNDYFTEICLNYILIKLIKMGQQYPKIFGKYLLGNELKKDSNLKKYLENIKRSSSHIVFKAKGAILYLKYKKEILGDATFRNNNSYTIDISKFSSLISELKGKESFYLNTFMMTPPSFFRTDIVLNGLSTIDSLSSGERQRIHSVSSILYHIVNLNSVEEQKLKEQKNIIKYEYINLILDEIELYYHPEWQRLYVNELIKGIEKLDADKLNNIKGLNIVFLTHSPFILSDIPANNVLKLINGSPRKLTDSSNTFGANIHNLLANDFFLENGFMGEFAKEKINNLIRFLNINDQSDDSTWTKKGAYNFINLIGEDILRNSLLNLYLKKYKQKSYDELLEFFKLNSNETD